VSKVIDEVTSWFDDEYYHGGGDEPVNRCWEDNKSVSDYMAKHNVTGNDLLQTFLTKELAIIKKNKKTAILWEDAATQLHLNIPKDTILQVWTGTIKDAVTSGYKVIASSYNFFYLDCRSGNWKYVLCETVLCTNRYKLTNQTINSFFIAVTIPLSMNRYLLQFLKNYLIISTTTTLPGLVT
jgi:hypothetical protein